MLAVDGVEVELLDRHSWFFAARCWSIIALIALVRASGLGDEVVATSSTVAVVEDEEGGRYWVFRCGDGFEDDTGDLSWWMHGVFG